MLTRLPGFVFLAAALILFAAVSPAALAQASSRTIVLTSAASPVTGKYRLALVIGNSRYDGANELVNPGSARPPASP
ncbi:MAG: hypothetical protein P4L33_02265 [Capsulimonadaceae bacterium]|nr:hypothetical protein [Capsulimonadaceae bacterium]